MDHQVAELRGEKKENMLDCMLDCKKVVIHAKWQKK
jgi:hypothetical protein